MHSYKQTGTHNPLQYLTLSRSYKPRVKLFVIFRQRARKIVDVDVHSWNVTVAQVRTDVGPTHIKEVWTQSSHRVFADISDGLVHRRTKQHCADQLVAVVEITRNGARLCQLVWWRLFCYWRSWATIVKVFH